jgi:dihydrolipoamide dehydrogenase
VNGIGLEGVITTDHLLTLREVPETVVVLGGGPVELEAAQYLLFLGSRVTLVEEEGRILPDEDREIARRLSSALREQGMEILTGARVLAIEKRKPLLCVRLESKEGEKRISAQRVLHARRGAALDGIGLAAAGLDPAPRGLQVDEMLRTALSHILAVGDVTGGPMYSHRASAMGIVAAQNALGTAHPFRTERVPRAFYTQPEVAAVGLTEREAKNRGHKLQVATIPYGINARAMMMLQTEGAVKVVADARYGEILGVHMVGPHATELISEGILAMEMEATVEELAAGVRLHPSLSESQVDAAREAMGRGIYVVR